MGHRVDGWGLLGRVLSLLAQSTRDRKELGSWGKTKVSSLDSGDSQPSEHTFCSFMISFLAILAFIIGPPETATIQP